MALLSRLWTLRDDRPAFVAGSLAALALFLAYPLVDLKLQSMGIAPGYGFWDFGAYGGAIDRWQAGEPIYVRNEDGGYHGKYLYPPVFLLLFRPFFELPFRQAALAWNVLSVALLWVAMQLVVGSLGADLRWWERLGLLWVLLGFQPLLISLKLAQVSAFITGLLALALVGLVHGERGSQASRLLSGACTAVGGTVKLAYAPVGAHLLADRDRLAGAVATGGALLGLSLLVFGVDAHLTYVEVLAWGKGWGDSRSPLLWLPPYYRPFHAIPGQIVIRVVGSVAVAALAVGAGLAGRHREPFALGVTAMPLLAPQADAYYFVALLPVVALLLALELERDGRPLVPVVGVVLLNVHAYGLRFLGDTLPAFVQSPDALVALLQPGLWGNVLLFGLAAVRTAQAVPALAALRETGRSAVRGR